jgi:hypothetical protein
VNHPQDYNSYVSCLIKFISYRNKIAYALDWEFSIEELSPITPEMIYRWFAFKVLAKEDPTPDDNPTYRKSNTLLACKKMMSFFILTACQAIPPSQQLSMTSLPLSKRKRPVGKARSLVQTVLLSTVKSIKVWILFTSHYHQTSIASIAIQQWSSSCFVTLPVVMMPPTSTSRH